MKTLLLPRFLLGSLIGGLAFSVHSQAAMILEYTFDGNGLNTGTTGTNNLSISGSGESPTYAGPAATLIGTGNSFDNTALTYNTIGQVASAGSVNFGTGTSITISGWVQNVTAPGSGARIVDKGATLAGGVTLQFSGPNLNFQLGNGTTLLSATSSGYSYNSLNKWIWFGVTYDSSNGDFSFYKLNELNEVTLVSTATSVGGSFVNNSGLMRIMNTSNGTRAVDGYLDDLRVFNDVQSIAQMQALAIPIPEPSATVVLAALAALGTVFTFRKKRR